MRFFALVLAAAPVGLAGCSSMSSPAGASDDVRVISATFGVPDEDGGIRETQTIPFKVDSSYKWHIEFESRPSVIELREVLQLPAPTKWHDLEGTQGITISESGDRLERVAEIKSTGRDTIWGQYYITAEDPKGPYSIAVYFGDKLLHKFEFVVE